MKVVAILQARMGSTRLPGKALLPAAGKPLIAHMVERARRASTLDELWLATSLDPVNAPLVETMEALGVPVFRGSEDDVLSRFTAIAQRTNANWIVRLTGDCPLLDPEIVDAVVRFALDSAGQFDYVGNALMPTYPDGLDVEAFTRAALEQAAAEASTPLHREHVTPLIHRFHDERGHSRVGHFSGNSDFSHLRWTVDEPEDYELVREIFETLSPSLPHFGWLDVVALMTRRPELLLINSKISRNEGFFEALAQSKQESKTL